MGSPELTGTAILPLQGVLRMTAREILMARMSRPWPERAMPAALRTPPAAISVRETACVLKSHTRREAGSEMPGSARLWEKRRMRRQPVASRSRALDGSACRLYLGERHVPH
jgi:hypothetical protein